MKGQSSPSFVPSVIKTNIPLNDDPAHEEILLQRYRERIEKLSQRDRLSKFCTDAGFLTAGEVGQYFTTKDTEELSQFIDSVVRSVNLFREFSYRLKVNKFGALTTSELVFRHTERQAQQCVK